MLVAALAGDGMSSWSWALGQTPFEPKFPLMPNAEVYSVGAFEAWPLLVDTLAPLAKLLANGRRQGVVFGPEIDRVEHLVQESVPLRFDPAFGSREDWRDAERRLFFHLHRLDELPCQQCACPAGRTDALLLSPQQVRRLFPLRDDASAEVLFARFRAWVPILLCASCAAAIN